MVQRRITTVVRMCTVIGALLGLVSTEIVSAADYKIVANKSVPVASLGKGDLQAIFLGEKSKWEDGKPIKIVVLEEGEAHKAFLQNIISKTPSQFENYWKKLVFTGKGSAPKSFGEMSALVDFVAGHPGAIGYVAAAQAVGSAKAISLK